MAHSAHRPRKQAKAVKSQLVDKGPRPGSLTLDPATEKEVNGIFFAYLKRLGLTTVVMAVAALIITLYTHASHILATDIFFISILLGLFLSYRHGVARVFAAIRRIGIERARQRRYADAAFVLEHFHKTGNMNFDRDGAAHYHLILAYLGLDRLDSAERTLTWLRRHRRRSPFLVQAEEAYQKRIEAKQIKIGS